MKKIIYTLLTLVVVAFSINLYLNPNAALGALSILKPTQGGTGVGSVTAGDVGSCLKVLDDSPFTYEIGSCGGAGTIDGTGIAGMITSWLDSDTLTATSGPTALYFTATSTTATSTLPNLSTSHFALGSDFLTDITGTGLSVVNGVLTGNTGTVTNVAMTAPTGLTVTGSPITTTGTLALTYTSGYEGLLTASSTNWNGFYNTPSTRITDGTGLTWSTNTLNCDTATSGAIGCLASTDWSAFNNKVSSTSIDSSAEIATLVTDETGSGALVFGTNATLASTTLTGKTTFQDATSTTFFSAIASSTNLFSALANFSTAVGIGTTTPSNGLMVAGGSITNAEVIAATSSVMSISLASSTQHLVRMGSSAMTIYLTNAIPGQAERLMVCNPSGTAGALTILATSTVVLRWNGGTVPTQTTTANKCDLWTFTVSNGATSTIIAGSMIANY